MTAQMLQRNKKDQGVETINRGKYPTLGYQEDQVYEQRDESDITDIEDHSSHI